MVLKLSHCGKKIRITRKVSNCVTGKKITKISWTDRVRNEEVFERVKKESNILYTIKKAERIGHILRRNCLLKHAIERKREVMGRRGRRRKQLLDEL